jgi:hypothetical protein
MRRLAQMVAALLLCLLAGQPLAAAWIATAEPGMACCRKGKGTHGCCKRKTLRTSGATLTAGSDCGAKCCCQLVPSTDKPFAQASAAHAAWPLLSALLSRVDRRTEPATGLDRTQWQRPPPSLLLL